MARIKIKGINEFREISDKTAMELLEIRNNTEIPNGFLINTDEMSIEKGDIGPILIVKEKPQKNDDYASTMNRDIFDYRRRIINLKPKERAITVFEGHLKLYAWAVGSLDEIMDQDGIKKETKDKAIELLTEFFEQNPSWIIPSFKVWVNLFGKQGLKNRMNPIAQKILANIEANERKTSGQPNYQFKFKLPEKTYNLQEIRPEGMLSFGMNQIN